MIKTSTEYLICNDGTCDVTAELQALINSLECGDKLIIKPGTYLVSSLFLKSNMDLELEADAILLATTDESKYPIIPTRVAGIEMDWYGGILNVNNCQNVTISGQGTVNGSGEYWWNKYWGQDYVSGMRKDYDHKGLRWAVDYDCMRVRNIVIANSENIKLTGIKSMKSGFWNVHILYSNNVNVDNIQILENGDESPSTDGIDIDSSCNVIIENCKTSCHDDSICIKSGRDGDGHQIGIPCHDIIIRNCEIHDGMGMTIGSEVSGGVYNIKFENIKFIGTDCGFRIKSSNVRKGYIKDITVENIEMTNVRYPFNFNVNWNPEYSVCELPADYVGKIPDHWHKLLMKVPSEVDNTRVENIHIKNVKATLTENYTGPSRAFQIEGFADRPISKVYFENIEIKAKEYGLISYVEDINFKNASISATGKNDSKNDQFDNR